MGSHFIKETTLNMSSPTPLVSPQTHPWPSSTSSIQPHTPAWIPSWQVTPPTAPAVGYQSDLYATPVTPFIPPLSSGGTWPPMQPSSPVTQHTPSSNVAPRPPSSPQVTTPIPAPVSTPTPPPIHRGVLCDMCNEVIEGVRHKCLDCRSA